MHKRFTSLGIVTALALSLGASGAMAGTASPSRQCGRVFNTSLTRIVALVARGTDRVCGGDSLTDVGTKLQPSVQKLFDKLVSTLNGIGSCDPDASITFPIPHITVDVADVTGLIQNGVGSGITWGVRNCNGIDDP